MRDTRSNLVISGALAVVGAGTTATGGVLFESQGETFLTGFLIFVGLMIAPISIFYFLSTLVSGARKAALERGTGELARWTLTPTEWSQFRAQEARMIAEGRPVNDFSFRERAAGNGEVVFAKRAVIVDGDYHDLTPGGLVDLRGVEFIPGAPACLEFAMQAQKPRGASGTGFGMNYSWLRVPVGAGDTRQAMQVMAHYRTTTKRGVAIAMRNPKLTIVICLGVAAVCALSALWGFSNTEATVPGDGPLIAAVVGVVAGIGALLLAAIVAYRWRTLKP